MVVPADFSEWLIETTDMNELDIVAVAVGVSVDVRIDAIPRRSFIGIVTEIAEVSAVTRGDVTYAITICFEEDERQPLRWGMSAFVEGDAGP